MKKDDHSSSLPPWVIIPFGGLLVLGLCYIGYFAVYMLIESVFYPDAPTSVPAGIIRNSYTVVLLLLCFALLRTKIPDLFKAIIFIGPMTMLIIAVILAFYLTLAVAALSAAAIAVCCLFLLYRYKKPWIYYYAMAIAVVVAIAYAWPRA